MTDKLNKIKELKQMLDDGSITEEEFAAMKADLLKEDYDKNNELVVQSSKQKRKGISWPEVLGVLFGPLGGLAYLFTKQGIIKKGVVLLISLVMGGVYASLSSEDSQVTKSTQPSSQDVQQSQVNSEDNGQDLAAISIGTFAEVRADRTLQIKKSEMLDSIQTNNQFIEPIQAKGGKLIAVYLTIKNTGNESGDMLFSEFKLRDGQNRTFDEIADFEEIIVVDMWAKEKGLAASSDQLFPGGTSEVVKVFRVSPDAEDLKLVVNNKTFAIN